MAKKGQEDQEKQVTQIITVYSDGSVKVSPSDAPIQAADDTGTGGKDTPPDPPPHPE